MARARVEYTALRIILVNGVRGYNVGDPVPASAVENLGLVAGVDVEPAAGDAPSTPPPVVEPAPAQTGGVPEPPGRGARKQDWVRYAIARGMDPATAEESTIDQLAAADYDLLFSRR